mmetsp:Transcript_6827/g.10123  ORF Transcript_6827/g.10123 Transcript_6827/m.10123 type:complete len:570 (+) Transcript_6827:123-1832(+)
MLLERLILLALLLSCTSREDECERKDGWHRRGQVIVCQPNIRLGGGGAASMHQIHHGVLRAGIDSRMYAVNPRFATNISKNMTEDEFMHLAIDQGLGPEDVLFVPEIAQFPDEFVHEAQRHGGTIVRMILGAHPYFDRLDQRVLNVGRTYFNRRQMLGSIGPVLQPPLEDIIYQAAAEYKASSREKPWPLLVLVDDDTNIDDAIQEINELSNGSVRLLQFRGFDRATTLELFQNATLFIDGYIPGIERALWEAALFDVVPLINHHHHGASEEDFPIEAIPRFEAGSYRLFETIIHYALNAHLYRPNIERYFNSISRGWPQRFRHDLSDMLYSRHFDIHTVWRFNHNNSLIQSTPAFSENAWLLPLLVSTLCLAPLSTITVFVMDSQPPQLHSFVDNQQIHDFWLRIFLGPAAFDLLEHTGLLSRIRFQFEYGPKINNGRPFALHFPPRSILINSPKEILDQKDILSDQTKHIAFYETSRATNQKEESSLLRCIFSSSPTQVDDTIRHGTPWNDVPRQLQAEHRFLSTHIVFTSSAPYTKVDQLSSTLQDHPLWQVFFPLFHSNVRRILG